MHDGDDDAYEAPAVMACLLPPSHSAVVDDDGYVVCRGIAVTSL